MGALTRPSTDADLGLLRRWVGGDRRAGDLLFRQFYDPLDRFFARKVSDEDRGDLVHNAFLALLKSAAGFRGECSLRSYLFRISHHVLVDYYRKKKRHDFDPLTHSVIDAAELPAPRVLSELNRNRTLQRCIEVLPLAQRELLELYYWEGLSSNELAAVFEVSPATIRSRVHVVRQRLIASYTKVCPAGGQLIDADDFEHKLGALADFMCRGPTRSNNESNDP